MKYLVIDGKNYDEFVEEFDSKEKAIKFAIKEWDRMSDEDKLSRDNFYVLESVNPDEDAEDHYDGNLVWSRINNGKYSSMMYDTEEEAEKYAGSDKIIYNAEEKKYTTILEKEFRERCSDIADKFYDDGITDIEEVKEKCPEMSYDELYLIEKCLNNMA